MNPYKHVVFIIPSLQQGGLENHVVVLANQISRITKNRVSIICLYNNTLFYEVDKGIETFFPSYKRKGYSTLHYYWKSFLFTRQKLKELKPDAVVSFGDYINFISIAVCKSINLPVFVGDMSSPGKTFPFFVNLFRRWTYPMAKGIIAQTKRAKDQKVEMVGPDVPIQIIPNPLRVINKFEVEKEKVILGVARHYHVKGIDRLLEAFAKTKDKSWKLEIAGSEGPETNRLKDQAKRLNISERVIFLGARKDIDYVYSYSSIFVLSSRSEGLPNALIEAMAHGLPCISFDINAGPSDVVEHGVNGILVEDGNIEVMAARINELMDSKEKRKAFGCKATEIKEKLSIDRITNELLNFIHS